MDGWWTCPYSSLPRQQCLYLRPLPQWHGSLREGALSVETPDPRGIDEGAAFAASGREAAMWTGESVRSGRSSSR